MLASRPLGSQVSGTSRASGDLEGNHTGGKGFLEFADSGAKVNLSPDPRIRSIAGGDYLGP
jgi:hypothetical protein